MTENALSIVEFKHPKPTCYILGAEDSDLPNEVIKECKQIVKLPGERCFILSVAGGTITPK